MIGKVNLQRKVFFSTRKINLKANRIWVTDFKRTKYNKETLFGMMNHLGSDKEKY